MPNLINTPEENALANRFGRDFYEKRYLIEQEKRLKLEKKGKFFRISLFNLFLKYFFKCIFLWKRGYRNYLTPKVEEHYFMLPRLPKEFDGYRILHLSDLHLDLDENITQAIIDAIEGLEYDLCVITGDLNNLTVSTNRGAVAEATQLAKAIHSPIYACLGNHDFLKDICPLEAAGINFLLNEGVELKHNGASIWLGGVDEANVYENDDIARAFSMAPVDSFKLLLSHTPSVYAKAAAENVDLVLAGHVHGGQICLPGGLMFHKLAGCKNDPSPERVWVGRWQEGEQTQGWTSRGIGACGVPLRFNCPPEAGIIILNSAKDA